MRDFDKRSIADFLMRHTDEFVEWYKSENSSEADLGSIPDAVAKRVLSDAVTALSEAWFDEEAGFFYDRRMMRLEAKLKETDPNDIEGLLDIQRQIRDLKKSNA